MELTIEIRPRPGKFQELYQTLRALVPTIRNERRCRDCGVSLDGEVLFLSSDWDAQADVQSFMRTTSGSALLGAIDVLSERAAVKTGRDAPWEGIGVLRRMRRENDGGGKPFPCPQGEETGVAGQGTKAEASETHDRPRQSVHEEVQP